MKKHICLVIIAMVITACGRSSVDNEAVGQVKTILKRTPLICEDYTEIGLSLGVMRNGIGSVSHEDMTLAVENTKTADVALLKTAAELGWIVKIRYDVERVSPCWPTHRFLSVEVEAKPGERPTTPEAGH